MNRKAFTLIELLVVVAIIALLIAILLPSFAKARSLSRQAVCASNLHQLCEAMIAARQANVGLPINHAFPGMEWPSIPSTLVSSKNVFHCPEAALINDDMSSWTIVSNQSQDQYGNSNPTSFAFAPGVNVVVIAGPHPGTDASADGFNFPAVATGHTQYRIDDGYDKDLDDVTLDLNNGTQVVTNMVAGYHGTNTGSLTIYHYGQPYPGWAFSNSGTPAVGATFIMNGAAAANYAINYRTAQPTVAGDTIVLLDYDLLIANNGETPDMRSHLQTASRHLGKINVLYADGSVKPSWGLSLDPVLNPAPWSP